MTGHVRIHKSRMDTIDHKIWASIAIKLPLLDARHGDHCDFRNHVTRADNHPLRRRQLRRISRPRNDIHTVLGFRRENVIIVGPTVASVISSIRRSVFFFKSIIQNLGKEYSTGNDLI